METKQKILNVSLELFAMKGFLGTSTSDIANKLNITKGALYKHYNSKQEIFDSILKKMNEDDTLNASKLGLPLNNDYENITIRKLCDFAIHQFLYWTEDEFAILFRRFLTIEQYRSEKIHNLYKQYLLNGQLEYVKDILIKNGIDNAKEKAFEFFSPLFLCYNLSDTGIDKKEIINILKKHFDNFINNNR